MRKFSFFIVMLMIIPAISFKSYTHNDINALLPVKDGDVIFNTSGSSQSMAIQMATHSKFSHCGIIFYRGTEPYVYEALQPVTITPLKTFIRNGNNGKYTIKRLVNTNLLTKENCAKLKKEAERHVGKNYDLYFDWSDEKIYCSELVWKTYKNALNIEPGALQKLSEFDLSHPLVKTKLKERFGNKIPMDEKVISPEAIYKSELFKIVEEK